jgi:hypothetical protein
MQSDKWMQTRLSPTMGIVVSVLCGIIGGVLITIGATLSGWFVAGGLAVLALAVWGLAVSLVKTNRTRTNS